MLLLLLLAGCARVPPACEAMCEEATAVREGCLEEAGQDWSEAGFVDAADHTDWCLTWAWEQRLLERDAGEPGRTEALCEDRADALQGISCEDYDALAW